jgi:hypothetical protein
LKTVEQPIITRRRHYYEDWLMRSGLEAQQGAPHAAERAMSMYLKSSPTINRPYSCYGLRADSDPNAANLGYFYHESDGKRYRQQYPGYTIEAGVPRQFP